MIFYKKILFLLLGLILFSSVNADNEVQKNCFDTLKTNMKDIGIFEKPYSSIKDMEYSKVESQFSKYYKNMSSFGIDLDEPLFEMRLYSYGRQTGYQHPPVSPFPVATKSDKWDNPSKEYIIAEEYIKDPKGNRLFLSCSFMQISAADLMKVTSNNYWYDSDILSVLINGDNNNKIWYNTNISFNFDRIPFVKWDRLFIYPKETRNDYFNRYDIVDSFPGNKVNSINDLITESNNTKPINDKGEYLGIFVTDLNGKIQTSSNIPSYLKPVEYKGNNLIFPLFDYYQNIQNTFPKIGDKLALNGLVHFNLVKKIIGTKDNPGFAHIWNTTLDTKEITKVYKNKLEGNLKNSDKIKNNFYLSYLDKLDNTESDINKLLNKNGKIIKKIIGPKDLTKSDNTKITNKNTIIISILILLLIPIMYFIFIKKNKKNIS